MVKPEQTIKMFDKNGDGQLDFTEIHVRKSKNNSGIGARYRQVDDRMRTRLELQARAMDANGDGIFGEEEAAEYIEIRKQRVAEWQSRVEKKPEDNALYKQNLADALKRAEEIWNGIVKEYDMDGNGVLTLPGEMDGRREFAEHPEIQDLKEWL